MGKRRRQAPAPREAKVSKKPLTLEVKQRITSYVDEAIAKFDLVLFDFSLNSKWEVVVTADTKEGVTPGKGITIKECADVTRYLEALLDADEGVEPDYKIEVSSPGIDRPLTKWMHYLASVGRKVKIVLSEPVDNETTFEGLLESAQDNCIKINVDGQNHYVFNYDEIAKGRLAFDFSGVTEG